MRDRVVTILVGLRWRLLRARAAEAAGVAGTAGGLTAAALMGARILVGLYPVTAALVALAPLAAGGFLIVCRPARARLDRDALVQWIVTIVPAVCGLAALAAIPTGYFTAVSKNALFLILPGAAVVGAAGCVFRGRSLAGVAAWIDRQAHLRERLSTAWELQQRAESSPFAQAVHDQALAAAEKIDPRAVRFWSRTPATSGAVGLAILGAALMLPWAPLESPATRQERQWRQVSRQAGDTLEEQLTGLEVQAGASGPVVAQRLARLADLVKELKAAPPGQSRQWQGKVVELDRLAESLRQAAASGQLDERTARQVAQLIRTLEQVSSQLAERMTGGTGGVETVKGPPAGPPTTRAAGTEGQPPPEGWAIVYNPQYAALAPPPGTSPGGLEAGQPRPLPYEPIDQAWQEARRRAAEGAGRQDIPPEYRQLIRDFFADNR